EALDHVFGVDVLAAVHHAEHLDAVGKRDIENHVVADGEAAQIFSQAISLATGQRTLRKHLEDVTEAIDQPVRGNNVVRGDVGPDQIKISLRLRKLAKSIRHVWLRPNAAVPAP